MGRAALGAVTAPQVLLANMSVYEKVSLLSGEGWRECASLCSLLSLRYDCDMIAMWREYAIYSLSTKYIERISDIRLPAFCS